MIVEDWPKKMAEFRPRVHRYCARMLGSAFDGEDVVQETLIKATAALGASAPVDNLEAWVLRIAHNTSLDALRSRRRRGEQGLEEALEVKDEREAADREVAVAASLESFRELPVLQRSSVVLVDVLGYSLNETAALVESSLSAVKSALHRGRERLKGLAAGGRALAPAANSADTERLRAYAERFNAREFEALRDLLAEDARLDLVNRSQLAGRKDVANYFSNYAKRSDCRVELAAAEGRLLLLMHDSGVPGSYVVLIDWHDGRIGRIRDFHFARYIMQDLAVLPFE